MPSSTRVASLLIVATALSMAFSSARLSAQAGSFDWGAAGEPSFGCTSGNTTFGPSVDEGVTLTITLTENPTGLNGDNDLLNSAEGCGSEDNWVTSTTNVGGSTNNLLMGMDATNDNSSSWVQVTFAFDPPLTGLSFRLGDVDFINGFYRDQILVEALDSGGMRIPPTLTLGSSVATSTSCPGFVTDDACLLGVGNNAPVTQTVGNAAFQYDTGSIATLRIRYFAADGNAFFGNPTQQYVGISAISYTNTLPVVLSSFESQVRGSSTDVAWRTESEMLNAGFRLLAQDGGKLVQVAEVASSDPDSRTPQSYEVSVSGVPRSFVLEDVDLQGRARRHGPFEPGLRYGGEPEPSTIDWRPIRERLGMTTPLERVARAAAMAHRGMSGGAVGGPTARLSAASNLSSDFAQFRGTRSEVGARLLVSEPGIQRLSYETLLASGVDLKGVWSNEIAVLDNGRPVSRYVGGGSRFGPGSWIEFLAEPRLTLWSPVDVFELRTDRHNAQAVSASTSHGGRPTIEQTTRLSVHEDQRYSFAAPNDDPFYDVSAMARPSSPALITKTFDLPDLRAGGATLTLDVWGGTDMPESGPDHHVLVRLNGALLGDERFDGIVARRYTYDATGLLHEAGNVLELELPGDTGHAFDLLHLEGFDLDYTRETTARGGRYVGKVERSEYGVSGFGGGDVVGWIQGRFKTERVELGGGDTVAVPNSIAGGKVWLAEAGAEHTPGIEPSIPEGVRPSRVEYLIVTHPALEDSVQSIAALEASRGYSVDVVTTDAIYATYSDHQEDPAAIGAFLRDSSRYRRLEYVLLVGATTYDPYDHLHLGSLSLVPTPYVEVGIVKFTPSDELLVDFNRDGAPDVALGRIPARTPEEVAAVADKLWAWSAQPSALLASGGSTLPGQFPPINSDYAAALAPWSPTTLDFDAVGKDAVRAGILEAFGAQGPSLVSYVGHTSYGLWDFSRVFQWQDVANLTNTGRPVLVAQWGCWNSYHVAPDIQALSSHLILEPQVGAAGVIGATTLTSEASHQALGKTFFAALADGAATLGEAWVAAKEALLASGSPPDALYGMALFGDPATPLPSP